MAEKDIGRKQLSRKELLTVSALGTVLAAHRRQLTSYARKERVGSSRREEALMALREVRKEYKNWVKEYGNVALPMTMEIGIQQVDMKVTQVFPSPQDQNQSS